MRYTFEFRDLATNNLLEEAQLVDARWRRVLNGSETFSATLPISDPLVRGKAPYELTTPAHTTVYAYRDGLPVWGGIIWTRHYDSESKTISIGAADWWSYFDHRKLLPLLPGSPGTTGIAPLSVTYANTEQNQIARNLVTLAQSHTGGDIGIELDASTSNINRDRTWWGYQMASVGEELRRLCSVLDGPDMRFTVGAPSGSDGKPRRLLLIGDPKLGQDGSPFVFEYGKNIQSYRWPTDGTRMATRTYAIGDGLEQATPIAVSEDTSKYALGWPLLESDASYSTVSSGDVLQEHADSDQLVSRLPVALPALRVRGDSDPPYPSWSPGDDARVLITDEYFTEGLATTMRIIADDCAITQAGETITLTMSPVLEDVV